MYAIYPFHEQLWHITLSKPFVHALPGARPNNVYLLRGSKPHTTTLINAGHFHQTHILHDALRDCGVDPGSVERILVTSWSIDHIGGIHAFPNADVFVLSPDMQAPSRYDTWLDSTRQRWELLFAHIRDREPYKEFADAQHFENYIKEYYPPNLTTLNFIPLRQGHHVMAADFDFEVHATPGPDPGHMCLWDPEKQWLFTGNFSLDGIPQDIQSVREYLGSVEKMLSLTPSALFPNYGRIDTWGKHALHRGYRYLSNFVTNIPMALSEGPTLLEFVERDLGFAPHDIIRYTGTLLVYQTLLDELARAHAFDVAGKGLTKRYGIEPQEE